MRRNIVKNIMQIGKRTLFLAATSLLLELLLAFLRHHAASPVLASPAISQLPRDWPTYRGNFQRSGSIDRLDGPGPARILWTFRETIASPSDFSSSPAVVGNRIYVASANVDVVSRSGFIYCLDTQTGQRIWQVPTRQEVYCSPAVVDGRVYVGEGLHENTGSLMRCLDASNGKLIWEFKVGSHAEGPPTIRDGRCYFGAGDDGVYCVDAIKGKEIWHYPGYHVDESPVLAGDILLVGSGYDHAHYLAINAENGKLIWHRPMEASVWGTSAIAGDRVYFGLSNAQVGGSGPADLGKVLCVNIHTGKDIWTYKTPRAVGTSLVVADDQVFFGCWDGFMYCLGRAKGDLKWKTDTGGPINSSPAIDSKRIYLGTTTGNVMAISRNKGEINWKLPIPGSAIDPTQILASPALVNGRLYVGTTNNQFVCIGE